MSREHIHALRRVERDLRSRPGGEALLGEAGRLLRYYVQEVERGDVLVAGPRALPPGTATTRRKPRRKRRHKPVTEDFVLEILRESDRPLTVREIGERLRERGRGPLSRQGMSYVLLGLARQGKVDRQEVAGGPHRCVWRAVG